MAIWSLPKIQYGVLRSGAVALSRLKKTPSGFPALRPQDSRRLAEQIQDLVEESLQLIRAGDVETKQALLGIIASIAATDAAAYPREILALRILQARIHLVANDLKGVRASLVPWLDHPHAAEAGVHELAALYLFEGKLHLLEGEQTGAIGPKAVQRLLMLSRLRPQSAYTLFRQFAPLVAVHPEAPPPKGLAALVVRWAKLYVRLNRPTPRVAGLRVRIAAYLTAVTGGLALTLGRRWPKGAEARRIARSGEGLVVSRAMGGIGDLIMMTPGLRELAKRHGRPVKFVISRKFFPVFENNPDVELIDMDGPAADFSMSPNWRNLTLCPASAYESRVAPFIKRGRVRLFAGGMGVSWKQLQKAGTKPILPLAERDQTFADSFLESRGFGKRTLIGVQPYSRDSYKDHPGIVDMIVRLAEEFDVLVFHHIADGLPQGERIATTAGLGLAQSLALTARLDALVSVDSAFLHAASAFDVPVVALFGPTDGAVVADHHDKKVIVTAPPSFACMPCWRNEDMKCRLTGQTGVSPCMAEIPYARVRSALDQALAMRVRSG